MQNWLFAMVFFHSSKNSLNQQNSAAAPKDKLKTVKDININITDNKLQCKKH